VISVVGDDTLVDVAYASIGSRSVSAQKIDSVDVDESLAYLSMGEGVRFFASNQTDIAGSATLSLSYYWASVALAFVASAGGDSPVAKIISAYMGGR
jgi:hypothetical protein